VKAAVSKLGPLEGDSTVLLEASKMVPYDVAATNWLASIGSWASILSLVATVFVAWKVWGIERFYKSIAIIPRIRSRIKGKINNLNARLTSKDWPGIQTEAAGVIPQLSYIMKIAPRDFQQSARSARDLAYSIKQDTQRFNKTIAQKLINELTELHGQIDIFVEDNRWRSS
jgi:hypothetical protein